MDLNNINKGIKNSLKFLDNEYIYCIIVVILVLYNSLLFMNVNDFFSNIYKFGLIRVIILLLIVYFSQKSYLISLLLALSYTLSIYFERSVFENKENFSENEYMNYNTSDETHDETHDETEMYNNHQETQEENEMYNNQETQDETENFFTLNNGIGLTENMSNQNNENDNENEKKNIMNNALSQNECINNYKPSFKNVGDVCSPVATYEGEFNAQGLNYPIGHNM